MVRHRHLMANEEAISRAFWHDEHTVVAGWLPFFHDMGLIGNLLQPLYAGVPCVFMSPVAFMQRPSPLAAHDRRLSRDDERRPGLRVRPVCTQSVGRREAGPRSSGWRVAFTGAEPVRADTLRRFTDAFAPCGFSPSAWLPCFGLAEATLMVSGRARAGLPTLLDVDRDALGDGRAVPAQAEERARRLVGCGPAVDGTAIAVVDPETDRTRPDGAVGEIWIAGPGVADGYWSNATATIDTFHALLTDREGHWLRTGDLGFLHEGELFIAGRLKDLIIVRGRNHHPADLEATVGQAHAALHAGGSAAFAIEREGEERVIVVQECVDRRIERPEEIHGAIRAAVSRDHDLELDAIVLVTRGGVAKTTSGKTRRGACRDQFLARTLPVIASWTRAGEDDRTEAPVLPSAQPTADLQGPCIVWSPACWDSARTRRRSTSLSCAWDSVRYERSSCCMRWRSSSG